MCEGGQEVEVRLTRIKDDLLEELASTQVRQKKYEGYGYSRSVNEIYHNRLEKVSADLYSTADSMNAQYNMLMQSTYEVYIHACTSGHIEADLHWFLVASSVGPTFKDGSTCRLNYFGSANAVAKCERPTRRHW